MQMTKLSEEPTEAFNQIEGFIYFSKLSNLYFPDFKHTESACKRMRAEIKKNEALYAELCEAEYTDRTLRLSPLQQEIIIHHFGYPVLKPVVE
ncbi:MAG: DUF4248 domain-containing protein [Bacteroides sp.]